jgi:hypothetical protein
MRIYYDTDGVIFAAIEDDMEMIGSSIVVTTKDLPKDFMATFAIGKYKIIDKKIKTVESESSPPQGLLEQLIPIPIPVKEKKTDTGPAPKKTQRKKRQ